MKKGNFITVGKKLYIIRSVDNTKKKAILQRVVKKKSKGGVRLSFKEKYEADIVTKE